MTCQWTRVPDRNGWDVGCQFDWIATVDPGYAYCPFCGERIDWVEVTEVDE